jgi:hypothetical protein
MCRSDMLFSDDTLCQPRETLSTLYFRFVEDGYKCHSDILVAIKSGSIYLGIL